MILTGRPSRPPFLLVCSSQICAPSRACLPLGDSGPVSAMAKPILIGGPLCENAGVATRAGESSAAPMPAFTPRRVIFLLMWFPPEGFFAPLVTFTHVVWHLVKGG